jgi:hypothetical protein
MEFHDIKNIPSTFQISINKEYATTEQKKSYHPVFTLG